MKPIPDHLETGLSIIFIGYNPSLRSGEIGHHYANPSNRFWQVIYLAGLTPRKYRPEEDNALLALGYGLTNIVARPSRTAAEITREEYQRGRDQLRDKIRRFRPQVACFVGKGVYEKYSRRSGINWGIHNPVVPGVIDFVAPSSSGLVRMGMKKMVEIYCQLKKIIQ